MSSAITALRSTLVAELTAAIPEATVHDGYPDLFNAPSVIVVPARDRPYVSAVTFGQFAVALDALVLATDPAEIDGLIESVLINSADHDLAGVDSPSATTINGADVLFCAVHLSKLTKI